MATKVYTILFAAALCGGIGQSRAAEEYVYAGPAYTLRSTYFDSNLWSGDGNMRIKFVVQNLLPNNATINLTGSMSSWSMSDGTNSLNSITNPDAFVTISNFFPAPTPVVGPTVVTDASGSIVAWSFNAATNGYGGGSLQLTSINNTSGAFGTPTYHYDQTDWVIDNSTYANSWTYSSGTWSVAPLAPVPEPMNFMMMSVGLILLGWVVGSKKHP